MFISQKNQINSLSQLLDVFEKEVSYGTPPGELNFLTGRIGELYTAIIKNGQLPVNTNQHGYDVEAEGEYISVKTTTSKKGSHHFSFNKNTLNHVTRIMLLQIDTEEIEIKVLLDATLSDAKKLMVTNKSNENQYIISQSKVNKNSIELINNDISPSQLKIIESVNYEGWEINRRNISPKIAVFKNNQSIQKGKIKAELRTIAGKLGVEIIKDNGILYTTNELGAKLIKQIKGVENLDENIQ